MIRNLIPVLMLCLCFVSPTPVLAQTYSSTESALSYVYVNGSHMVKMESQWIYSASGGGSYQWAGNVVQFDLTISAFTSQENYTNGIAHSTNLYTFNSQAGEWIVEALEDGSVRVKGHRYVSLQTGFVYALSMQPKCRGEYKVGWYGSYSGFVWPGVQQTLGPLDLLHPGDD